MFGNQMYRTTEGFALSRPLLLPDARSFSDVLEYLDEWDQFKTESASRFSGEPPASRVIGRERDARRTGNQIGPFCTLNSFGKHRSMAVRATDDVINAVTPNLVTPDDSLSFRLHLHADRNRVLVILEHGYIIGSHWIAYIDAATIPAYPYERRDERYQSICQAIKEDGKEPFIKHLPGGAIEVRVIIDRGRAPDFRRTLDPNLRATIHADGSVTRVWADGTTNYEGA